MSTIKAEVWLTEDDLEQLGRVQTAVAKRDADNGLNMDPRALRDLILSQAVTEGLDALGARWIKQPGQKDTPTDGRLARLIQSIFNGTPEQGEVAR